MPTKKEALKTPLQKAPFFWFVFFGEATAKHIMNSKTNKKDVNKKNEQKTLFAALISCRPFMDINRNTSEFEIR